MVPALFGALGLKYFIKGKKFAAIPATQDIVSLMTHEQYSYPDYFNYIPDHLDRVEEACRLAAEYGCTPAWFSRGIWGNESWNK